MTKPQLIEAVANKNRTLTKSQVKKVVDDLLSTITSNLKKGNQIALTGFGTFAVKSRKARDGRNPQTGEPMRIKASKSVGFKVGKKLKDAVN